jgi:hypothetical protein
MDKIKGFKIDVIEKQHAGYAMTGIIKVYKARIEIPQLVG